MIPRQSTRRRIDPESCRHRLHLRRSRRGVGDSRTDGLSSRRALCEGPTGLSHLHLLVKTLRPNLGAGMQSFLSGYAIWSGRRWRRTGHLFQGWLDSRFRGVRGSTEEARRRHCFEDTHPRSAAARESRPETNPRCRGGLLRSRNRLACEASRPPHSTGGRSLAVPPPHRRHLGRARRVAVGEPEPGRSISTPDNVRVWRGFAQTGHGRPPRPGLPTCSLSRSSFPSRSAARPG
jgi:hypothetical protein